MREPVSESPKEKMAFTVPKSFIHSFNKWLVRASLVSGIKLGPGLWGVPFRLPFQEAFPDLQDTVCSLVYGSTVHLPPICHTVVSVSGTLIASAKPDGTELSFVPQAVET